MKEKELQTVDDDHFDIELRNIRVEVGKTFPPQIFDKIKKISYDMSEYGLSEEEACVASDMDYGDLSRLKEKEPILDRLFKMNSIEFQRKILKNIVRKAQGDEKLGQWLLEVTNPEKYNPRKGGSKGTGNTEELLEMAYKFVQDSDDSPVKEKSGKAFVYRKKSQGGNYSLEDYLK